VNHEITSIPNLIYKHTFKTPYLINERNAKCVHGVAAANNEINNSLAIAPGKDPGNMAIPNPNHDFNVKDKD
jgi:hypothetical protein